MGDFMSKFNDLVGKVNSAVKDFESGLEGAINNVSGQGSDKVNQMLGQAGNELTKAFSNGDPNAQNEVLGMPGAQPMSADPNGQYSSIQPGTTQTVMFSAGNEVGAMPLSPEPVHMAVPPVYPDNTAQAVPQTPVDPNAPIPVTQVATPGVPIDLSNIPVRPAVNPDGPKVVEVGVPNEPKETRTKIVLDKDTTGVRLNSIASVDGQEVAGVAPEIDSGVTVAETAQNAADASVMNSLPSGDEVKSSVPFEAAIPEAKPLSDVPYEAKVPHGVSLKK